jgi:hypothetical protein
LQPGLIFVQPVTGFHVASVHSIRERPATENPRLSLIVLPVPIELLAGGNAASAAQAAVNAAAALAASSGKQLAQAPATASLDTTTAKQLAPAVSEQSSEALKAALAAPKPEKVRR